MTSSGAIAKDFLLFPQLATELRLKIWTYALYLSPRIVELCQLQDAKYIITDPEPDEDTLYRTKNIARFYSPTAVPVLLQAVNRESRSVALEHYTLSFPNIQSTPPHPPRTWFCPELDLLYFPSWCFKDSLDHFELGVPDEAKAGIRRLGRDNLVWYAPPWSEGTINNEITIAQFPGLEEFVYVQRDTEHMGCACCLEYEGPEEGVVHLEFVEPDRRWTARCRKESEEAIEAIGKSKVEKREPWAFPKVSFALLLRDGKLS